MTTPLAVNRAYTRKVLQTEANAVIALVDLLNSRSDETIQLLLRCRGRVIVTSMGK